MQIDISTLECDLMKSGNKHRKQEKCWVIVIDDVARVIYQQTSANILLFRQQINSDRSLTKGNPLSTNFNQIKFSKIAKFSTFVV